MNTENAQTINRVFLEHVGDPTMKKKAEERMMGYLRKRIYEDSFMEKILPSKPISPSQCDRVPATSDSPVMLRKVIDKEFVDVQATAMDFRGKGGFEYIDTETYNVDFYKIESPEYHITEGELRAKEMPIQALVKHHTGKAIEEVIDTTFIDAVEAAITATGQEIESDDKFILPNNIVDLQNIIDGLGGNDSLQTATLLMTKVQFNNIFKWQSAMDVSITADFWKDGFRYLSINGLRIVVTIKSHIVPNNVVYAFAAPEFIGHHYRFNDERFQIEKKWDDIAWKAWKSHGAAIGNNRSCAKLTLATDD